MRLALVQRYYPHYREPIFDRLACSYPDLTFTLFCEVLNDRLPSEGIAIPIRNKSYVVGIKNYKLQLGRRRLWFQIGALRQLTTNRYDVVLLELGTNIITNLGLILIRRLLRRPTIVWLKGWFPDGPGRGPSGRLKRLIVCGASACVCYGRTTQDQLIELGVPPERCFVAQNTVDVTPYLTSSRKRDLSSRTNEPKREFIFSLGRLTSSKRFDVLIRAFAEIQRNYPRLELLIGGTGPEQERLKALVRSLDLVGVEFLGPISPDDAARYFIGARICVFAGDVGLSLSEAMAAGAPIICADESGPDSELLEHGTNGLRVLPGDLSELASALQTLLSDQATAQAYGNAARDKVTQLTSVEMMADAIVASARSAIHNLPADR